MLLVNLGKICSMYYNTYQFIEVLLVLIDIYTRHIRMNKTSWDPRIIYVIIYRQTDGG